jgi:2-polyprenyl-3-methyl-5-hydroxy-6-metoxy-1,4-benzoquinol methylase
MTAERADVVGQDEARGGTTSYAHVLTPPEVRVPVSDREQILAEREPSWADAPLTGASPRGTHPTYLRVTDGTATPPLAQDRCVPWADDLPTVYEHLHRYVLAARHVAGRDVLDLASGEGYGAALLAGGGARRVVGLELDEAAVRHARAAYPEVTFVQGSASDPAAVQEDAFDVVTCFGVLEQVPDHEGLRLLVRRALRPGGLVVVSVPDPQLAPTAGEGTWTDQDAFRRWLAAGWAHVAVLAQSPVVGSVLEPLEGGTGAFRHEGVRRASLTDWASGAPAGRTTLVGVASDAPLPPLGPDLLSDVDLGAVLAPQRRVLELEEQLRQLRLQLARSEGWEANVASLRAQLVELTEQVRLDDSQERLAAELAWRAEFERSRAGRLLGSWRAVREALHRRG